ncbi:MAG: hypothetical protein ACLPV8_25495 [Steroidobacteraceae bacterium]
MMPFILGRMMPNRQRTQEPGPPQFRVVEASGHCDKCHQELTQWTIARPDGEIIDRTFEDEDIALYVCDLLNEVLHDAP